MTRARNPSMSNCSLSFPLQKSPMYQHNGNSPLRCQFFLLFLSFLRFSSTIPCQCWWFVTNIFLVGWLGFVLPMMIRKGVWHLEISTSFNFLIARHILHLVGWLGFSLPVMRKDVWHLSLRFVYVLHF